MNEHTKANPLRLWSYVHNELPQAERQAIEQRLTADEALGQQVAAMNRFDRQLRAAFAIADADEHALADRALAAWDQECAAASGAGLRPAENCSWDGYSGPEACTTKVQTTIDDSRRGRSLRWPLLAGLAAAAVLLMLCMPLGSRNTLSWERPAFEPLIIRGAMTAPTASHTTPETARICGQELRDAVTCACRTQHLVPRSSLSVSVRVQAFPKGDTFAVSVKAHTRDGALAGEWNGDYSSIDAFRRQLPASALQIAKDLSTPPGL